MKLYTVCVGSSVSMHIQNNWTTKIIKEQIVFDDAQIVEKNNEEFHITVNSLDLYIKNSDVKII